MTTLTFLIHVKLLYRMCPVYSTTINTIVNYIQITDKQACRSGWTIKLRCRRHLAHPCSLPVQSIWRSTYC